MPEAARKSGRCCDLIGPGEITEKATVHFCTFPLQDAGTEYRTYQSYSVLYAGFPKVNRKYVKSANETGTSRITRRNTRFDAKCICNIKRLVLAPQRCDPRPPPISAWLPQALPREQPTQPQCHTCRVQRQVASGGKLHSPSRLGLLAGRDL
ncbi:hypothetical protein VTN31DRAFT_2349 [Thermomyces dupontii]|uniref:uncharacterized protein n=1 Tax=Talaromyces thermophilus TaxID=28565 RepID=UPI003743D743